MSPRTCPAPAQAGLRLHSAVVSRCVPVRSRARLQVQDEVCACCRPTCQCDQQDPAKAALRGQGDQVLRLLHLVLQLLPVLAGRGLRPLRALASAVRLQQRHRCTVLRPALAKADCSQLLMWSAVNQVPCRSASLPQPPPRAAHRQAAPARFRSGLVHTRAWLISGGPGALAQAASAQRRPRHCRICRSGLKP